MLITEFADSGGDRLKILLGEMQLGDSKPSTLLRQMLEFWPEANSTKNFSRTFSYIYYRRFIKQ